MIQHKIVRVIIHHGDEFTAFPDNGFALAPGQRGCKQSGNFNVLLFSEQVRNADRIIFDKPWLVVLPHFFIEKIF